MRSGSTLIRVSAVCCFDTRWASGPLICALILLKIRFYISRLLTYLPTYPQGFCSRTSGERQTEVSPASPRLRGNMACKTELGTSCILKTSKLLLFLHLNTSVSTFYRMSQLWISSLAPLHHLCLGDFLRFVPSASCFL